MKKILLAISVVCLSTAMWAQDASGSSSVSSRKVRVGVFVRGTPSWYNTDKSNYYKSGGAIFGVGFGLSLEFKLNEVLAFKTGIGGDFDGGKINYTYTGTDSAATYTAYLMDKSPKIIDVNGKKSSDVAASVNSINFIKDRYIKTSYVTIPVILKMMTKEISGFKYYVDFGANIGVLVGAKTNDNVLQSTSTTSLTSVKNSGLNVYNECIPIRAGLNLGLGAEYRLAGSTSIFFGANFINSFIPVLKATSANNFIAIDSNNNFISAQQSVKSMGIQINVGILF